MELIEFGSIMHLTKGKKPKRQISEADDGCLPYVDIKAFETGCVENFTDGEKCLPCEESDILIVCDGSRSGLVGRAMKGYVGSTLAIISADGMSSDYLYYFLQGLYEELNSRKKGTGTPHLDQQILAKKRLLVPSIEKQQAVVEKIEELLTGYEAGFGTLQKVQRQVELYRQAIFKNAFSRCKESEVALEELCEFITKGTTPSKDKMTVGHGEIPYIKVYNLTFNGYLDFSIDPTFVPEETHKGFLQRSVTLPGDVLMNIVGPPLGKVSIVPDTYPEWNINQAIARFRCKERLNNRFLAYYLQYAGTIEKMTAKTKATVGQQNLTLEICRNIMIPLPSVDKQLSIVKELDEKIYACENILHTVDLSMQQAIATRRSILKKAFEGRLI